MRKRSITTLALTAGVALGALLMAPSASATVLTVTFQGTVAATFIDTNDVYGFGAGADLTGDAVTDVYHIDTTSLTFSSGSSNVAGTAFEEYDGGFGGLSSATSTIDGHTITLNATNGDQLTEFVQQTYLGQGTPANVYNQSILELQAIGVETTGDALGSEFLIRDEAVSYSLGIPLSLDTSETLTVADLNINASAPGEAQGVFFPYVDGSGPGFFNDVLGSVVVPSGTPEPATWAMLLVGFGAVGGAARISRWRRAVTA